MFNRFVLSLCLGAAGSIVKAQSPGTFTPTGNLTTERQFHTATLLPNGKVLIAGGFAVGSGLPVRASAELYDPATGTFTPTASMATPRGNHTATLLPSGKVLIVGGTSTENTITSLATAELYDPATGNFSATGAMTTARAFHTATLLDNGSVLIAGAYQAGGSCCGLATAELYDPSTGTFTATGNMNETHSSHTAVSLPNGMVLIDGGSSGGAPAHAEIYTPDTGTFQFTAERDPPDLYPSTASLLPTGKVLITLEESCDGDNQAEVYDASNQSFTATGNMTYDRGYITSTLLPEGKVLIAGRDWINFGGSADIYDPVAGSFGPTAGAFRHSEEGHTATLLPDGSVLFSGGWICCGYTVATAEIYHPAVLVPSPVLYSLSGGTQGAILHARTARIVSANDPSTAGEALEMYGAGLIDGSVIPPQVAIGGRMAQVLFFGNAPGYAGLDQINIRVPSGITPGPSVPVRLTYLARPSNAVTIGLQ